MATIYYDQFFILDPANPPVAGTQFVFSSLEIIDQNDDNLIDTPFNDTISGLDIIATWPDDTITVIKNGTTVSIVGCTFYLSDGSAVFCPNRRHGLIRCRVCQLDFYHRRRQHVGR